MTLGGELRKQIIANTEDGQDEIEDILDWLIDYLSNAEIHESIEMLNDKDR